MLLYQAVAERAEPASGVPPTPRSSGFVGTPPPLSWLSSMPSMYGKIRLVEFAVDGSTRIVPPGFWQPFAYAQRPELHVYPAGQAAKLPPHWQERAGPVPMSAHWPAAAPLQSASA